MHISLIAAMAQNRVIGRDDATGKPDLPWHLPDDFAYFKRHTLGHAIIMGRKSFEALGKPLPKRANIIVTRNTAFKPDGATVVHTLDEAIETAKVIEEQGDETRTPEIFVIGGGEIYKAALPLATRIYLTEIQRTYDGDTQFPQFDKAQWREVSRHHHPADGRHEAAFDFVVYER
ncbi:Dihydrofolate reductase [Fibrella aestuarina BUZ 2]|uniref:Dihydrofolate reductase n=1 Tax=Fibrella aestuarina BUZ 2 TaxID=1166018 RepID=I0K3I6_9BACT|nr:dihydrofolate reductase [Fibrella aestuarina]CCG98689.1 Dihydrofolate reductase [Fibrella aestuarina BUZ 2]